MAKFRFAVTEWHSPSVTKTINDNYKHSLPNCTHRKLRKQFTGRLCHAQRGLS